MGLKFYFFSPLKMEINMEISELYGFGFEKGKNPPPSRCDV
jgi:hypothetical protein